MDVKLVQLDQVLFQIEKVVFVTVEVTGMPILTLVNSPAVMFKIGIMVLTDVFVDLDLADMVVDVYNVQVELLLTIEKNVSVQAVTLITLDQMFVPYSVQTVIFSITNVEHAPMELSHQVINLLATAPTDIASMFKQVFAN